MLFAIQQEGKLGGATELKTAYEIFKNTYINAKQRNIETLVRYFSKIAGIDAEYKIKDVNPVGVDLNPLDFKDLLPKAWVMEKLGIDIAKYEQPIKSQVQIPGNDALVNISGRQQQNLMRIVRLFSQGKLTKNQAAIQLQAYGFTTEQINQYLGLDDNPQTNDTEFSDQEDDFLADLFSQCGDNKDEYFIINSKSYDGSDDEQFMFQSFADYNDKELKIMELIKNNLIYPINK